MISVTATYHCRLLSYTVATTSQSPSINYVGITCHVCTFQHSIILLAACELQNASYIDEAKILVVQQLLLCTQNSNYSFHVNTTTSHCGHIFALQARTYVRRYIRSPPCYRLPGGVLSSQSSGEQSSLSSKSSLHLGLQPLSVCTQKGRYSSAIHCR